MFFNQQTEAEDDLIQQDLVQTVHGLKILKPKLMTNLNHEQEILIRKRKKRSQKRINSTNQKTQTNLGQSSNQRRKSNKKRQSQQDQYKFYKVVFDGNDKISGYWVNGLLEGQVEIHYHNGDYFKGKFSKGYKVSGIMKYKDQGQYQGNFSNQMFHGKGVLNLKHKKISAYWINGMAQQNCSIQYDNGNLYYGPIKQYKKHGYGYLYFTNDTKYHGQFVQDQIKGYGQYYEKGKIKFKGIWLNGRLIQPMKLQQQAYNQQDKLNWDVIQQIFATKSKMNLIDCFVNLSQMKKRQNQLQSLNLGLNNNNQQQMKSNLNSPLRKDNSLKKSKIGFNNSAKKSQKTPSHLTNAGTQYQHSQTSINIGPSENNSTK